MKKVSVHKIALGVNILSLNRHSKEAVMQTWHFLTQQTGSLSAPSLTTEGVLLVPSPAPRAEPAEQQADKQIAASALRHQSCPPGFVCKTSFCACDPFPFLPHSVQQDSRAARQGRIRPKINFIKHSKTVGRTQLTLLPQLNCAGQTMHIPIILPAFAFSRFVTETL